MIGFGIIGFGRIGQRLAARLPLTLHAPELAAVLVRPRDADLAGATVGPARVCIDIDDFVARRPDIAVECASPNALSLLAPKLLAAGIDVAPLSLCAFADLATETKLIGAAMIGPGRLEIPPGATGSLDLIAAAREDDLRRVIFRVSKPAQTWRRTHADALTDLDAAGERRLFFKDSMRQVARLFPDLNTGVAVALAGLGLDRTEAELYVDANTQQATFEVELMAGPGDATITVRGRDAPADADPADYTTFSLMRLLRRRQARIMI